MDLQEIQAQIRSEAEQIQRQLDRQAKLQTQSAGGSAEILYPIAPVHIDALESYARPTPRAKDGSYHYRDIAVFEDEAFVDAAYRALLRHAPDAEGLASYTRMLRSGKHKAEVLARLRYSHEGRAQAVRVRGLLIPAAFAGLCYIPLVGAMARWTLELLFLSRNLNRLRRTTEAQRRHMNQSLERLSAKLNEQSRVLNALLAKSDSTGDS